jgi:glycerate kinase
MRVVVAPDSFKGSLSSAEAASAMAEGLREAGPFDVEQVPVADGGEGLMDALVSATGGVVFEAGSHDALGRLLRAKWGMLGDGATAVVEMAACAGLPLIEEKRRDVMRASTYGVGEIVMAALQGGARRVILGLGGSATNDAGGGMAKALGFLLTDDMGQ